MHAAPTLLHADGRHFNVQNLRGQALLFRCLDTGFVTTAPVLTRYQQEPRSPGNSERSSLPERRISRIDHGAPASALDTNP